MTPLIIILECDYYTNFHHIQLNSRNSWIAIKLANILGTCGSFLQEPSGIKSADGARCCNKLQPLIHTSGWMLFLKCQLCPHCWMNRWNFKVLCRKSSSGVIIQSGRWRPQTDPLIFHLVSFPSVHFPIKRSRVHLRYGTAAVNDFSALSNLSQRMNTVREEGIQTEVTKKWWKKEI